MPQSSQPKQPPAARKWYCGAKVGLGLGLDVGGTIASAIPGTGQVLVLTQLTLSSASAIYSAVTHNRQGILVGGIGYALTTGGLATESQLVARAVPVVGAIYGAIQTYTDIKTVKDDYQACLQGN
jgi:hypothetical protein